MGAGGAYGDYKRNVAACLLSPDRSLAGPLFDEHRVSVRTGMGVLGRILEPQSHSEKGTREVMLVQ